jgi:thiamine pyrophosphokinase
MRALILAGGDRPDRDALDTRFPGWRDVELVVGADAGARHAAPLGLPLHLIVGDFDSLDPAELAAFEAGGVRIEAHPTEKDATDTELALIAALEAGAHEIGIVASWGGRPDHALGTLSLLAHPRLLAAGAGAVLLDAASRIRLVRAGHRCTLNVPVGTTISLLPWGHDAVVTATGVRWPLHRETLAAGTSRGISNVATATSVDIDVERGMLFVGDGDGR